MNRPTSRHLSHDYEAYKGLSLRELFWIVIVITPLTSVLFTLVGSLTSFPVACGCVGFLVGFILAITVCPKRLARIKAGKPQGYLMKKTHLKLAALNLKRSPYLHYQGMWLKSRTIGRQHDV